jgi:hypothetical protein
MGACAEALLLGATSDNGTRRVGYRVCLNAEALGLASTIRGPENIYGCRARAGT